MCKENKKCKKKKNKKKIISKKILFDVSFIIQKGIQGGPTGYIPIVWQPGIDGCLEIWPEATTPYSVYIFYTQPFLCSYKTKSIPI